MKKQPYSLYSPVTLIVTLFYIGKIPFASGTFGSIFAAATFWFYSVTLEGFLSFYYHLAIVTAIGYVTVHLYVKHGDNKDPKEVVIDEYVGQYIAQLGSLHLLSLMNVSLSNWAIILVSFVFFRIFDIAKPSIVGFCDRNLKGAHGVMMDDIVAGVFAMIFTVGIGSFF